MLISTRTINILFIFIFGFMLTCGLSRASILNPSVRSYELDVSFYPVTGSMSGVAAIRFTGSKDSHPQIYFYIHGELKVTSVMIGEKEAEFKQNTVLYTKDYSMVAKQVTVNTTGVDISKGIKVIYSGSFNPSGARSRSDYMRIDSNGVLLRAYYYSPWFPIFLEPDQDSQKVDFSKVILRTPMEFITVFTGTHKADRLENGIRISEWSAPNTELNDAQCTSRKFEVIEQGNIRLYAEKNDVSKKASLEITRAVNMLSDIYARDYRNKVANSQIHIMQMPEFGDISSGNVVGMTSENWKGFSENFFSKLTLAHELVHPFVMFKTEQNDPLYSLSIEGFPVYMHLPALAELYGEDNYKKIIEWYEKRYIDWKKTGENSDGRALPPEKPITLISQDEIRLYKDGFILGNRVVLFQNWLRKKMGSDHFKEFTRELFSSSTCSYENFRRLVIKYLPDAGEDFTIWMETNEYPERLRINNL